MPVRTTAALVRGINPDVPATDPDSVLTPYIATANQIVNDNCLASSYDATLLELIERWLSAHFYAVANLPAAQEGIGSGAVTESKAKIAVDLGFDVTVYGQQAMRLDYAGNLAALDNTLDEIKKPIPGGTSVRWIGFDPLCDW